MNKLNAKELELFLPTFEDSEANLKGNPINLIYFYKENGENFPLATETTNDIHLSFDKSFIEQLKKDFPNANSNNLYVWVSGTEFKLGKM